MKNLSLTSSKEYRTFFNTFIFISLADAFQGDQEKVQNSNKNACDKSYGANNINTAEIPNQKFKTTEKVHFEQQKVSFR